MSKQQTALRLALEALKELVAQTETGLFAVRHDHVAMQDARQAITALREALNASLAKPDFWEGYVPEPVKPRGEATLAQQEPVAVHQFRKRGCSDWYDGYPDHTDGRGPYQARTLYTSPPAQRKPLTDEEIKELYGDDDNFRMTKKYVIAFARAIEAAHGIGEKK